ncbi:MAG TPA: hypothetical protein VHS31_07215 [Tepidisphaeraceae bacterium]|jgi:ribosomal protein S27AE|nr:hypothetical protein [Tepidisphaeraceae bacterium]
MSELNPTQSADASLGLETMVGNKRQVFRIRDGTTLGNDKLSDIYVDQPDRWHAIIRNEDGFLTLRTCGEYDIICSHMPARSVRLIAGTTFKAGPSQFECVELSSVETPGRLTAETAATPMRFACPRCRTNLMAIDLDAKYCPHCGVTLPEDCPEWPLMSQEDNAAAPPSGWRSLLPSWLRSRIPSDPLFFARPTSVLAYINTLFNLGLRHEIGIGDSRNRGEAMRYYRRAARLGNLPARVRLQVKQNNAEVTQSNK